MATCMKQPMTPTMGPAADGTDVSTTASEGAFSRSASNEVLPPPTAGISDGGEYNSCFYVPPPPRNVVRVYHNRKRTSYTDYPVENIRPSEPSLTLVQLLAVEPNPSRTRVCKVAFAEGEASEDSCLSDVLETPDMHGWAPLLIATQQRQADAVAALLSLGANVDVQNPETGCTPLIIAVTAGDAVIVRHLLDHKASVNLYVGPECRNALCEAIVSKRNDIMEMLLAAGADINLLEEHYPSLAESYRRSMVEGRGTKICASAWMTGYWPVLMGYKWHMAA